jgi:hypothetical protein
MTEPTIAVLGVYRVRATDALIQDRLAYSYAPDDIDTPKSAWRSSTSPASSSSRSP